MIAAAPLQAAAPSASAAPAIRWLLVTAHPDDEYYCAASIYRLSRELGGIVDQIVVTNGAGGHRFAALAGQIYGLDLAKNGKDHNLLPDIRKREAASAGKLLGIRRHFFLDEPDTGFTLDASAALVQWSPLRVRHEIETRLRNEAYDAVIVLLPRAEEHGHHQAVCRIALDAVRALPAAQRPALLAVEPGNSRRPAPAFDRHPKPHFEFSRLNAIAGGDCLTYTIIVSWMVAEYKSQGLFQLESGRHDCERFWVLAGSHAQTSRIFRTLNPLKDI